jgi:hypothetical protein
LIWTDFVEEEWTVFWVCWEIGSVWLQAQVPGIAWQLAELHVKRAKRAQVRTWAKKVEVEEVVETIVLENYTWSAVTLALTAYQLLWY